MKILIVDDLEDVRMILRKNLEFHDHAVMEASNGAEALRKAKKSPPDLIISDVLMPVMDGFTLCREWKKDERLRHIPLVFYTATYTDSKDEKLALSLGADRFIIKPMEPDEFINILKEVIKEREDNRFGIPQEPVEEEPVYLREYNEVLIRKLETKMFQLEEANKSLEQEIDERTQLAETLKESEEQFRALVESSADHIFMLDREGIYILSNEQIDQFDFDNSQSLIGRHITDVYSPEVSEFYLNKFNEVIKTAKAVEFEHFLDAKEGQHFHLDTLFPIFRNGEIWAVGGICRDITQRVLAEKALEQTRNRMKHLLDTSPAIIFSCRIDPGHKPEKGYHPTFVSEKITDIFGYQAEECLDNPKWWGEHLHPEDAPQAFANMEQLFKEGHLVHEYRLRHKDGSYRWLHDELVLDRNSEGTPIEFVGSWTDITDRKRAAEEKKTLEIQLQQSQKMEAIGTLAGGIAHDFNNILGIIIGNTELAVGDVPDWNPVKEYLKEILSASFRARDLVKQILSFSRQSMAIRKPLIITPVIEETIKLLRASTPVTISIQKNFSAKSDQILADPTQIDQILMNLCTNAAHSMREEGGVLEVRLENEEAGKYLLLTVRDTGTGIPPEIIDRIFDPYYTTKGVGEGTGMGLAVVLGIVKSYDGDLEVFSESGKGTTIRVYFPLTGEIAKEDAEKPEDLPTGNERILLVDDEESLVRAYTKSLTSLGYDVQSCTSPDRALELFEAQPAKFDLVITDMTMPKMTGDKLAGELIRIRPDIPVILCTGYNVKISAQKAHDTGIKAFAMKPLVIKDLANTIRQVVDG